MSRTSFMGASSMTDQRQPDVYDGIAPGRPLVLVVDDHEVGRKSLARLLNALGYEVVAASDGASALSAMEGPKPFDYVLTDLRLPDLDGRDVVYAARQLVPLPGIGLITGWDIEPGEAERLGLDWVFLKPLNVQEIVDKLRQSPHPVASSTADHPPPPVENLPGVFAPPLEHRDRNG